MKTVIGIDPGKSGAMAICYPDNNIRVVKMDEDTYIEELNLIKSQSDNIICWLEHVHAMPGQGVTSMFTFGDNYGWLRGALRALEIPTELIRPQAWQKGLPGLQGLKGDARKRKLKEHATRIFPAQKPTLNTADSLLIMRHGMMQ